MVVKGTVLIKNFISKGRVGSTVPVLHIRTWRQASDYISEPRSKVYNLDSIVMMYIILVNHVQLIAYNFDNTENRLYTHIVMYNPNISGFKYV